MTNLEFLKKRLLQRAIQRKLQLFGHMCRIENNRKLKFGIVEGTNKKDRPSTWWMDDIISWCKTAL